MVLLSQLNCSISSILSEDSRCFSFQSQQENLENNFSIESNSNKKLLDEDEEGKIELKNNPLPFMQFRKKTLKEYIKELNQLGIVDKQFSPILEKDIKSLDPYSLSEESFHWALYSKKLSFVHRHVKEARFYKNRSNQDAGLLSKNMQQTSLTRDFICDKAAVDYGVIIPKKLYKDDERIKESDQQFIERALYTIYQQEGVKRYESFKTTLENAKKTPESALGFWEKLGNSFFKWCRKPGFF